MNTNNKPSLWWIVVAVLVFLAGTGGGVGVVVWQILNLPGSETFLVPSQQTFHLEEPGTYRLWNDHMTTFHGKVYNKSETLPDQALMELTRDGELLEMHASIGWKTTSGSHAKTSIGRYEINEPGIYTLTVTGFDEERIFSFGRSGVKAVLLSVLACIVLCLAGCLGSLIIIIIVLAKRS
jgi:hypothetical protein